MLIEKAVQKVKALLADTSGWLRTTAASRQLGSS
jgi:hypothetical protein